MKRLSFFDMAKGIGIFLVVLGHASFVDEQIITWIFSFHMPLFFIISGMLITHKNEFDKPLKDIIFRKVRSILLPYLCFSICYTIIDFISVYFQQISLMDLKINAVCTLSFAGSGPLWFLPTLFISELLFVFILKKLGKKNGIICSLVVSAVGFTAWYFVEPVYTVAKNILLYFFLINIPFVVIRSMMCLVFLALASLVYTYLQKPAAFSLKELLAGLAFFIINIPVSLLNSNIDMHNMDYGKIYLFIPCAFLGSIGLILICRNIPAIKIIEFYGRNSLIIMATHLNFYILYLGGVVAFALNPYITRAKEYVFLFNILLTTMIVETILILIINRFLPWMIGKQYNRNKK